MHLISSVKVLLKGKEYAGEYEINGTTLRIWSARGQEISPASLPEALSVTGQMRGCETAYLVEKKWQAPRNATQVISYLLSSVISSSIRTPK
jgi:hypothetical protein